MWAICHLGLPWSGSGFKAPFFATFAHFILKTSSTCPQRKVYMAFGFCWTRVTVSTRISKPTTLESKKKKLIYASIFRSRAQLFKEKTVGSFRTKFLPSYPSFLRYFLWRPKYRRFFVTVCLWKEGYGSGSGTAKVTSGSDIRIRRRFHIVVRRDLLHKKLLMSTIRTCKV